MNIPLFRPAVDLKEFNSELKDFFINGTSKIDELEEIISNDFGKDNVVLTSNEASALHLALSAMEFRRGDKVILSVNSPVFIPEAVRYFDAKPIFIDTDINSMFMNIEKLEEALKNNKSKKLKAIIISHIAGNIMNIDNILKLAKQYDVKVIEDCTDALGAKKIDNKLVGTDNDTISIFGFHQNSVTSIVNSGFMISSDIELIERAKILQKHSIVNDSDIEYIYDVTSIGFKYNISELDSAYSILEYKRNKIAIEKRLKIAKIYQQKLKKLKHIELLNYSDNAIYSKFIIKIDKNRDGFAKALKEKGINVGLHYIPLHLMSYYKNKYELKVNSFPNSLNSYQKILSIPIYENMREEEVNYICTNISNISKKWI